ncbi:hypothetical protein B6A14_05165 [Polynucleobacter hirudinilacicola]|uniref:Uncharacterized protein n=1 Tax=Polynucleobacter hirudinilacicola TaxID=1743166 RepID=A0A210RW13_9BURK|nr:hypothetical protein [Polynucleobacter hirudinilacicola]OWF65202.1 hypothetical protein B6A14_05165 [Polynucleobacter hirudinilacicola]
MDFDWLSDPLLLYALTLAALLFGGIFMLILTIIIKHGRRIKSQKIQDYFVSLINQAKEYRLEGKGIKHELTYINKLIELHKKDVAYGWVRLLERTPKKDRDQFIDIAKQTNMLHCIPHCLNDEGIAEKCIALEAIGLSNFDGYTNEAKKYAMQEGIAPYACIALSRLIGKDSLPQIIESYKKGILSTTQALAAIVEIPRDQIINYIQGSTQKTFPTQLSQYLEFN